MEVFGLSAGTLFLAMLVIFFASLVKGTLGFGYGLLASPLLMTVIDPRLVIAIGIPIQVLLDLLILRQVWGYLDWKRVIPMIVAGVFGVPTGLFILLAVEPETLRLIVASTVLAAGLLLIFGVSVGIAWERLASAVTGFTTGALFASTGISGPPTVVFMLNQRWERGTFRSSLSAVNVWVESFALVSLAASGVIDGKSLGLDLTFLPVVLLSVYLSRRLVRSIDVIQFRRLAIVIVILSGVVGMADHFVK